MTHWLTEHMLAEADHLVAAGLATADRTIADVAARTRLREAEEAEQWRALACSPDAPEEWRRVAERVENGELTWADLAAGRLWDDPDVAAALAASRHTPIEPVGPADLDEELEDSPLRRD